MKIIGNNMNILFVVNSLSDKAGANIAIVRTLNRLLSKKNCSVYVLTKLDYRGPISEETKKEFKYIFFLPSDKFTIFSNLSKKFKIKNSKINELLWLITHPGIICKGMDIKFGTSYFTRKEYTKCIEKICNEIEIQAVIGVSSPYYIARAVSNSKINSIKAIYQLDPYTNNYTINIKNRNKRKKIEKETINNLQLIFAPNFIRNDLLNNHICSDSNKIIEANLPGIIIDNLIQNEFEEAKNKNFINLVFAGMLYKDIRNPEPLLNLMNVLPDNYRLHILGSGCENQIIKSKKLLKEKIIYHGLVSKRESDEYVKKADVLINIDNSIKNQMPSKIVDYICQQKKIINLCMDQECLAAKLLKRYSNGLNICFNEKSVLENGKLFVDFIQKKIKKPTIKDIIDNYKEYTDIYVADIFYKTISNFIIQ